jgi:hypothetical protein
MKSRWFMGLVAAIFASLPFAAPGQAPDAAGKQVMLFDFENDPEGWRADWGCTEGGPDVSPAQAHSGKSSIVCHHKFGKGEEAAAVTVTLDAPRNLKGSKLSAWVYLPEHSGPWQGQIYVRSGGDSNRVFGKLKDGLVAGWNQLQMSSDEMPDANAVEEIGVQVKNWNAKRAHEFFIDQIEIVPQD